MPRQAHIGGRHIAFVASLASLLAGCGWGHPQRPPEGFAVNLAPGPRFFAPESLRRVADRAGPMPQRFVQTSSSADEEDEDLGVLGEDEDEDEGGLSGVSVPSILAVTGTVSFDLPMSEDERVEYWVDFLSGRGRKSFSRWLARSTRYVPLFWSILEQYGLPKDLVFLSMIESGFSPKAYSWAHAAGAWQFMPYTGRRFGLKVGFWVDERRDFVKATHAAAQYLGKLHEMFGDWWLAMAAYNAGPGRMRSAMRRTGTDDFWRISRTRHLRRETKHYVPKLLAAARISKQPELYGFESLAYLPPLAWDVLTVTVATDLETLRKACQLEDPEALPRLNPELRCAVTPPGEAYLLRVPKGQVEACQQGLVDLNPAARLTYRYARLLPTDTLQGLAERHHTSPELILAFNQIDEAQLADLGELVVPVPWWQAEQVPIVAPDPKMFRGGIYRPDGQELLVHRVRPGDSLWRIARRYRVGVPKLRVWNGLWKGRPLRVGQRIKIYLGRGGAAPSQGSSLRPKGLKSSFSHTVRAGESLWSIGEEYGVSVEALRRVNRLKPGVVLQVGQRIRIR